MDRRKFLSELRKNTKGKILQLLLCINIYLAVSMYP